MEYSREAVALKLRSERTARELTTAQLAQAAGLADRSICEWESAEQSPDVESLAAIADAYGVSLDALTGRAR